VKVNPQNGVSHLVAVRAQGAMRGYLAGFDGENRVALYIDDFGYTQLAGAEYAWEHGKTYDLQLTAQGDTLTMRINRTEVLRHKDDNFGYGMYGVSTRGAARTYFSDIRVKEL
jgi:hypothetical protein